MDAKGHSVLLLQFAREPVEGGVKTRMMPHLSAHQACQLHCELVLWTSAQLATSGLGDTELCVAGDPTHSLFERCSAMGIHRISRQCGQDLGERMFVALRDSLQRYGKVILVGSDCPAIDRGYLEQAVHALDTAPLVLGPAQDGGYVLIGASSISEALFDNIPWGTAQVYAATVSAMLQQGLCWSELAALADVDRPNDLVAWHRLRGS
jgi:rSAM/selenodomain-associated transferase 1